MNTPRILACVGLCLGIPVVGCSGDASSEPGNYAADGGSDSETGAEDAAGGSDGADGYGEVEGPWECVANNYARWTEPGYNYERPCVFYKCIPGTGCPAPPRCETNDDCITTTAEMGHEAAAPVYCSEWHSCDVIVGPPPDH